MRDFICSMIRPVVVGGKYGIGIFMGGYLSDVIRAPLGEVSATFKDGLLVCDDNKVQLLINYVLSFRRAIEKIVESQKQPTVLFKSNYEIGLELNSEWLFTFHLTGEKDKAAYFKWVEWLMDSILTEVRRYEEWSKLNIGELNVG